MSKSKDQIQGEAQTCLRPLRRGSVEISMGVGKTKIGLTHISENYHQFIRVLVVAPKLSIFKSWEDDAYKFNMFNLLPHIVFTTYLSLHKHNPADYNILYLDEVHSITEENEPWLSSFGGKIVGLTGTAPRHGTIKAKIIEKYCPIVYRYKTDEAVNDDILNDYRIIVHKLSLSPFRNLAQKTKDGREFFTSEEKSYEYWTDRLSQSNSAKDTQILRIMRMKAMMNFPSKENLAKQLLENSLEKCLLFCNTQEQADKLCTHSYHSSNPNSDDNLIMFKEGTIDKMSCVLQISEGVTVPGLKEGIIMHAYGNNTKTGQRLGRLLRLNPDDIATAHILCYKDTVDEDWVKESLRNFDEFKISYK